MNRTRLLLSSLFAVCCLSTAAWADDAKPPANQSEVDVNLTAGTWLDIEKIVAKNADARTGKLVIVDVWSTSCGPCMEEFPHLLELQTKYPQQVLCVSLNIDYIGIKSKPPEFYRPRVETFLTAQKSTIANYLCTTESDEFFDALKLNSIPAVYVFGADGKLAKRFDDSLIQPGSDESFSYKKHINPFVADLLAKSATK